MRLKGKQPPYVFADRGDRVTSPSLDWSWQVLLQAGSIFERFRVDVVTFEFYARDHSVVRAEFGPLCWPYEYKTAGKQGFWPAMQLVCITTHWTVNKHEADLLLLRCQVLMQRSSYSPSYQIKGHLDA
jgi:hypothetical protein